MQATEETNQVQPGEVQTRIDPEVLSSLGISQEDVNQLNREKREFELYLQGLKGKGHEYYRQIARGLPINPPTLDTNFSMPTSDNPASIPDMTVSAIEQNQGSLNPQSVRKIKAGMKIILEDFGQAALTNNDWQTAVNAYDVATENGIMHNPQVLSQLRTVSESDKAVGVEIAQAIQQRQNLRKPNPTFSETQPQQTSAETGYRPAPNNPNPIPTLP